MKQEKPKKPDSPIEFAADPAERVQTVAEFIDRSYAPERLAGRHKETAKAHTRALTRFRLFLDREPLLTDLTADTCDRFETWLAEQGFAVKSGLDGRRCMVAIWRYAYQIGVIAEGPRLKRVTGNRKPDTFLSQPANSDNPTMLMDFARCYAIERGLTPPSAAALRYVVTSFGKSLKGRPRLTDLRADRVNRWLLDLQDSGRDPETLRSKRTALVGLWRAAFDAEQVSERPERIRKIRVPQKIPRAWSPENMRRLLEVAATVQGKLMVTGIAKSTFFRAWILVAYYSGLRRADLLALRMEDIQPDGTLIVVMHKTGNVIRRKLPADAMEAVNATIPPKRRRLFGDAASPARIRKAFARIVKRAGLEGSTKKLRKTGATRCEAEKPGSAMGYLGHRTPGLAYKNYVDPRFLSQETVVPATIASTPAAEGGAPSR